MKVKGRIPKKSDDGGGGDDDGVSISTMINIHLSHVARSRRHAVQDQLTSSKAT